MKKKSKKLFNKIILKKHAEKSFRRKLFFKEYKRLKNQAKLGISKNGIVEKRDYDKYKDYKKVKAPSNFTLIGNPEPVIDFISILKKCYDNKRKVFVVLKEVNKIDYDAIIVLLSIMVRFKSKRINFNGDFPIDVRAKQIITESGFFKNLFKQFREEDRYVIKQENDNLIHTHAQKNVDSLLGAKVIEQATKTIWGEKRRCQGAQRALIELILNTNNHATFGKEGDKHWWLSVNHRKDKNIVTFSFVDYGVGIFKSLDNKQIGNKFYKVVEKMYSKFKFKDNAELLRLILNGELHKTATGEHFRGKGLPGIHEAFKRNSFSNLYIISNNVYVNLSKGEFINLNCNFDGTFLYFEINNNNISCNGNN